LSKQRVREHARKRERGRKEAEEEKEKEDDAVVQSRLKVRGVT